LITGGGEKKMVQTPTAKIPLVVNAIKPRVHQIAVSQETRPNKMSHRSIQFVNAITPTKEDQLPTPLETFDREKMKSKSCADSRK
jgi:hypothetical protein